jgi:hypothetical protein
MPYPTQFPYDLLDAEPSDSRVVLHREKVPRAMRKRRSQAAQVRRAAVDLRNTETRLAYDILLVLQVPEADEVAEVEERLASSDFLPAQAPSPQVSLALSDVATDLDPFCQPVPARELPISNADQFAALPAHVLGITFARS